MLLRQRLAINAGDHQREGVHGFVKPQAFEIRPGIARHLGHSRRLVRPVERLKADKSGFRLRRNFPDQFAELKTRPGHYHGPGFNATQPVNAFFQTEHPDQLHRINGHWLFHQSADLNRPGCGGELVHVAIDILAQRELVKVVVSTGDFFIGERPVRIELVVARRRIGLRRRRCVGCAAGPAVGVRWFGFGAASQRHGRQTRRARKAHLPEKSTAIQKSRFRCHESFRDVPTGAKENVSHALKMPVTAV